MDKPAITGVQHVGIGVRNAEASLTFYRDVLACTQPWATFEFVHNPMADFFRSSPHVIRGWMYAQNRESIIVECIERLVPKARPIRQETRYGDIGVNKITVEVADAGKFREDYAGRIKFLSGINSLNIGFYGDYRFIYGADPDGNLIEFFSSSKNEISSPVGRICALGIGVTDLDRSISFYRKYLDFDRVIIPPHESFSGGVSDVSASADTQVRSCLLGNSNGYHMLELYEVSNPRGRSIPFHVLWGDYGYLEGCYLCEDVLAMARFCQEEKLEFTCYPTPYFIDRDGVCKTAWFMYLRDPDGILIELLELPKGL